MKCPICSTAEEESTVHGGVCSMTLLSTEAYYDTDGKYHLHDMNTYYSSFNCSNGHAWRENRQGECWCGWGTDIEPVIFILPSVTEQTKYYPINTGESYSVYNLMNGSNSLPSEDTK